ncbi:3-methyladenine DNA glycosylase [Homoserinimonas sp. OAct 916]|uniref:3-methyladenine DNA glycosylase n=1 Tax=Homoserinimonas sp. OAct 916 TaxID=2211450 RepID=UPI001E2B08F0|nr:3-methyladenine DNA glycosylase [Homoserinimonas sp. OAct 916]
MSSVVAGVSDAAVRVIKTRPAGMNSAGSNPADAEPTGTHPFESSAVRRPTLLRATEWRELERSHEARADLLTAGWRSRAGTGVTHPVEDFLFTYYSYRPRILRRWHPGANITLADAAATSRATWKWYRSHGDDVSVDTEAFVVAKGPSIRFIRNLLARTAARPGNFGCFGLHEWAMVYRAPEHRHQVPLRLGASATDEVVEANRIACTHFDAFRFFTPDAVGLNHRTPTRDNQPGMEQPGCLHAGMDVYKWAIKLGPIVPGDLLLDTFELAADIRELDMRASPYDLTEWGYTPVPIETPAGKAEYARQQRRFATRSNDLRSRVLAAISCAG